jgi:uncharacterized membrane protein YfcA
MHVIELSQLVSGFAVGMLVGMTGVGGGSLMTPILILLFGIHPVAAVGTDLLYAAATKSIGTLLYGLRGAVDWRVVARLAAGSLPLTVLTLFLLSRYDFNGAEAARVINAVLGLALFATATALIFRRYFITFYARHVGELDERRTRALTVATGAVLGVLVSVSSVGAGAIGVTALSLLYPRLPVIQIVAIDIAHAVPLTLAAGAGHWLMGSINWTLLGTLLLGSLPGVALGSHVASRVPDAVLRFALALILLIVGGRLLASGVDLHASTRHHEQAAEIVDTTKTTTLPSGAYPYR